MLVLDGPGTDAEPNAIGESHAPAKLDPSQCQEAVERTKTEEVPEDVRRANTTRYLEYIGTVKLERKLIRKILEGLGLRPPAPPPTSRGASYGAREVTAENRLAVTKAQRDRQDKISGPKTALTGTGEEPGARASSGENLQQQEPPGTRASSSMDSTR